MTTDPELFLRLLGEHVVTDRNRAEVGMSAIASAFVAVDVLPLALAQSVVRDYALAAQLRGFGIAGAGETPRRTELTSPPPAPRIAWGDIDDDYDHGFRYAVISDRSAEVTFCHTGSSDWSEVAKHFPKPQGFPNWLLLEDDTGKGHQAQRESQQMGGPWTGRFVTQAPLSPTTAWLDIGGRRMKLQPEDPPPPVTYHELPADSLPATYLRHLAATTIGTHFPFTGQVEQVAAAFRTCEMIAPEDPIFEQLADMMALLTGPPSADVPDRWASLSRGTTPAEAGTLLLGATTPVLDGAAVIVLSLECTAEGFTVDTWQFGGTPPMSWDSVQPSPPLAWWAQDDLGGWYRGHGTGFGGREDNWRTAISFSPPLDARARRLRLMPMALRSYAVVDIDLRGTWRRFP